MNTNTLEQRMTELTRQIAVKDAALRRLVTGFGAVFAGDDTEHNVRVSAQAIRQAQQALNETAGVSQ